MTLHKAIDGKSIISEEDVKKLINLDKYRGIADKLIKEHPSPGTDGTLNAGQESPGNGANTHQHLNSKPRLDQTEECSKSLKVFSDRAALRGSASLCETPSLPHTTFLKRKLLVRSGDVESNPGPTVKWPCSICNKNADGKKETSIKCMASLCRVWTHARCANIGKNPSSHHGFFCAGCSISGSTTTTRPFRPPGPATNTTASSTLALPPPTKPTTPSELRIMQWNVNGLKARIKDLYSLIAKYRPHIICLQELKIDVKDSSINFPEYRAILIPRNSKGGGVGILVKDCLNFSMTEHTMEQSFESVTVAIDGSIKVTHSLQTARGDGCRTQNH